MSNLIKHNGKLRYTKNRYDPLMKKMDKDSLKTKIKTENEGNSEELEKDFIVSKCHHCRVKAKVSRNAQCQGQTSGFKNVQRQHPEKVWPGQITENLDFQQKH
jgi:hypothetical protein